VFTGPRATAYFPQVFVRLTIAVVVDAVAAFGKVSGDRITNLSDTTDAGGTGLEASAHATGDGARILVGGTIAVVVNAVAYILARSLKGIAELFDSIHTVFAVVGAGSKSADGAALVLVGESIAVIVESIADFKCDACDGITGLDHTVKTVGDLLGTDPLSTGRCAQHLINLFVAIVIQTVTDLYGRDLCITLRQAVEFTGTTSFTATLVVASGAVRTQAEIDRVLTARAQPVVGDAESSRSFIHRFTVFTMKALGTGIVIRATGPTERTFIFIGNAGL
jgi:hypothetical protein